jgi:alanine racemase
MYGSNDDDVTNIDNVKIEDEVTLVGRDGENVISVEELANMAGSFNYEFVCGIGKRVPRIYAPIKRMDLPQ